MKPRLKQSGFTIVEIMISMLLGLIMMVGVVSLVIGNKRSFQEQNESSRIQENARFAIQIMAEDIRMAGYVGAHDDPTKVTNNLTIDGNSMATETAATDNYLLTIWNPIEGVDSASTGTGWAASGSTSNDGAGTNVIASMKANTDAITVRYFVPTTITTTASNSASPMTVSSVTGLSANAIAAIGDTSHSEIFKISSINAGALQVAYATGGTPANTDASLSGTAYASGSEVFLFTAVRYYIADVDTDGDGANDSSSLFRYVFTNGAYTTQELIAGVENMQLMYGDATNGFRTANNIPAADWDNVTSVKIALLLRSEAEVGSDTDTRNIGTGANDYNLLGSGAIALPDLRVRRRIFNTTVELRNRT